MYKSIKVSDKAYKMAKSVSRELEKSGGPSGAEKVNMSTAVGMALEDYLEKVKKKRVLRECAGAWKDMDTDKLVDEIYEYRKKPARRKEVKL